MTLQRTLFLCARVSFGLFVLLTSVYFLLFYIPFTRHSVIEWNVVTWLAFFVKFHPLFYWAALGALVPTLIEDVRREQSRRLAAGFLGLHALLGIWLSWRPLLSNLPEDERNFIWSLLALFSLVWVAFIDFAGRQDKIGRDEKKAHHLSYSTAVLSALFLSLLYVGVFYLRYVKQGIVNFRWTEMLVAVCWSMAAHLLVFTFVFVVLKLIRSLSGKFAAPSSTEFYLSALLASIVGTIVLRKVVFPAISFNNYFADLYSLAISLSIAAFVAGLILRLRGLQSAEASPEDSSLISRLRTNRQLVRGVRAFCLAAIAALAYLIPTSVASTDWNSLKQMLSVILIWILTFAFFSRIKPPTATRRQYPALVLLLMATLSFGVYKGLDMSQAAWTKLLRDSQLDVNTLLERYGNYDISFGVARKIIAPAEIDPAAETFSETQSFYAFLQRNTNLSAATQVGPVAVNLVEDLQPAKGEKPNIFIFVVDSLRRDYLSPYNEAVDFTPSIEKFARESIVMKNAFTRYGGTAFSEPSIWTGSLQLHKQYVQPFYPLNALQRLLEVDEYESWLTLDPILKEILKPSPAIVELDQGNDWMHYDFCRTLTEIEQKLGEKRDSQRPIFVYTQPQNVHLVSLKSSNYSVPPGEEYQGFEPQHASQVRRMDDSFGKFIQYLKARGLYDNSIVILTADHGDSLGEEGRWGHGPAVFPEVIRIPLIVHLPSRFARELVWETERIAFSTDITPSLYYLLGHAPIVRHPVYGRPLFTKTKEEQSYYQQASYLVASSYGPVYGVLHDNGRSLFIADALNNKEYLYDLVNDPRGTRNLLNASLRVQNEQVIRHHLEVLNRFYKFQPAPVDVASQ